MTTSKSKIAGWILSILLFLFLAVTSAMGKFTDWEGKEQMFEKMGFTTELMFKIGVLEVIIAVLFVIPRTGFLGAILLTGYLGGAVVTHVRVGDAFVFPVLIGVVMWIALGLRQPEIFSLAAGKTPSPSTASPAAQSTGIVADS
ncbi:MAG: DoxX family protein [Planctomycetaceae bacterium]